MQRLLLIFLLATTSCKGCVGASSDAELLPELGAALETIDEPIEWENALRTFEMDARIYRRPELANRIARLGYQAEEARQPEHMCGPVKVGEWIRAHLTRVAAELEGSPTTPVTPVVCDTAPRPIVRGIDTVWNIYGLDLNSDRRSLKLIVTSSTGATFDASDKLRVTSPVRAQVVLHGPEGLELGPQDTELTLKVADHTLSRVRITNHGPVLSVETIRARGAVALSPVATATVPNGYVMIAGGCRASFTGDGQLLTASYPSSPRTWTCRSEGHPKSPPKNITAYAVGIPERLGIVPLIATSASPRGGNVRTQVNLPPGYIVVSGGCRLTQTPIVSGHLINLMKPGTSSFECEAIDHGARSKAVLTSYAIGIPLDGPFQVVRRDVVGVEAHRGTVSALLLDPTATLVGGGCEVTHGETGNLIWAAFPRPEDRRWVCAHKDLRPSHPAAPTAFALGLKPK